jgi:hypothetical protein
MSADAEKLLAVKEASALKATIALAAKFAERGFAWKAKGL